MTRRLGKNEPAEPGAKRPRVLGKNTMVDSLTFRGAFNEIAITTNPDPAIVALYEHPAVPSKCSAAMNVWGIRVTRQHGVIVEPPASLLCDECMTHLPLNSVHEPDDHDTPPTDRAGILWVTP